MKRFLSILVLCVCAGPAGAETVRCVNAAGKTVYADSEAAQLLQNCRPIRGEVNTVAPQPGTRTRAPSSGAPARAADSAQAGVKAAEQRIEAAQKALAEQEAIRTGDERNYQRVLERLKPYQDEVEAAQQQLNRARRPVQ